MISEELHHEDRFSHQLWRNVISGDRVQMAGSQA